MIHEVQDVEQLREDYKNSRKPIKTYNNTLFNILNLYISKYIKNISNNKTKKNI